MNTRKDILWRVRLVFLLIVLLSVCVFGKAIHTQIFKGAYYQKIADRRDVDTCEITSIRGNILAADGSLMAVSVPMYELYFDAHADVYNKKNKRHIHYENAAQNTATGLANIFGNQSATDYMRMLTTARQENNRYKSLKKQVNYKQLKLVKNLPLFKMMTNGKRLNGKSPLIVVEQSRRAYPFGNLAARTIGYVNKQPSAAGVFVGLEGNFDNELSGTRGIVIKRRLSGGAWMPADGNIIDPNDGKDILTTIDVALQDVAQNALMNAMTKHNADYGCVIVMEVATGKIKAIANLGSTGSGTYAEKYNYAIGASIEPGSTFKLASVMAGLEKNYFKITDQIDLHNGSMYYGNSRMTDAKQHNERMQTIAHAFEKSSNVGISQAVWKGFKNNQNEFFEQLQQFHLHEPTGIEIAGETNPQIRNPADIGKNAWNNKVSLPFQSIGYSVQLTPLQILRFYNAIANNGKMMKPYIVDAILEYGKVTTQYSPTVIDASICSQSTIDAAKILLEGVVLRGTAQALKNNACRIGGKTGTAQIYQNNSYNKEALRAMFAGFFPIDNPKYSCIVMVENARQAGTHGAEVSAPVFKAIADRIYATNLSLTENTKPASTYKTRIQIKAGNRSNTERTLENMHYAYTTTDDAEWITPTMTDNKLQLNRTAATTTKVPNVQGMGLQDALYLMETRGIRTTASGKGKVATQSVAAGTNITKVRHVHLVLK
jgi:cell division protein FtsI (penicillin-binding protein 3)